MNIIADNIRKYREHANLSPQALAERIVVTRKVVSSWEHDEARPDLNTLILIATALNVDVMDLIYDRCSSEEFARLKPKRVRKTVILTAVFLSVLMSVVFLYRVLPGSEQAQLPECILNTALVPSAYASGSAALASVWAIWYDFRVSRKSALRILLLYLGVAYILFYYFVLYILGSERVLSRWLYDYPILFVLPGTLLFLGCNSKP